MEIKEAAEPRPDALRPDPAPPRGASELFEVDDAPGRSFADALWQALALVWVWKGFVAAVTTLAAIAAIALALSLPNEYVAAARVLAPETGAANPLMQALGRNVSSAAQAFFGGQGGAYSRYLTILSSRRLMETVVDSFRLVDAYELREEPYPREAALDELASRVSFPIDQQYEYMAVAVKDRSPRRAAAIANFMVDRLNRINTQLASQSASDTRRYADRRYEEARRAVDSLMDASQALQRRYGVYNVPAQSQAFFQQLGVLRAELTRQEITYETLQAELGPDNPQVQAMGRAVASARQRYEQAAGGGERVFPVAPNQVPAVLRQTLQIQGEMEGQRKLLDMLGPMVESARYQEEQQQKALQIVDRAVPPVRKSEPRRSILVVVATLSAFLLSLVFVGLVTAWRHAAPHVAARVRTLRAARP